MDDDNHQHHPEISPGTDLTAIIWKTLQSTQIQTQLDQSHNLYDIERLIIKPENVPKNNLKYFNEEDVFRIANIDRDLGKIDSTLRRKRKRNNRWAAVENLYLPKIRKLYNKIYDILSTSSNKEEEDEDVSSAIEKVIVRDLLESPTLNENNNEKFTVDSAWLANLGNYMDIRKNKDWVIYVMSDLIERRGPINPHPIYNKIPGWLFDAIQISAREQKYLIYSTDVRGANEWLGQFCSLINLHNLFSVNLETQQGMNCTAMLIHLAGILSTRPLNSINRQGMSYPNSILQKTTFESVNKFLSKVDGFDNLSSFISSTIACLPHKTGTNSFDVNST